MTTLYRSPVETLRREVDQLKKRLKHERAEVSKLEAKLAESRSEGLVKLIDICLADADATAELVSQYRKAIRVLEDR